MRTGVPPSRRLYEETEHLVRFVTCLIKEPNPTQNLWNYNLSIELETANGLLIEW